MAKLQAPEGKKIPVFIWTSGGGGGTNIKPKQKHHKKKKTTHTEDLTASEDLLFTCESFSPKRRTCSSQRLGGGWRGGKVCFLLLERSFCGVQKKQVNLTLDLSTLPESESSVALLTLPLLSVMLSVYLLTEKRLSGNLLLVPWALLGFGSIKSFFQPGSFTIVGFNCNKEWKCQQQTEEGYAKNVPDLITRVIHLKAGQQTVALGMYHPQLQFLLKMCAHLKSTAHMQVSLRHICMSGICRNIKRNSSWHKLYRIQKN